MIPNRSGSGPQSSGSAATMSAAAIWSSSGCSSMHGEPRGAAQGIQPPPIARTSTCRLAHPRGSSARWACTALNASRRSCGMAGAVAYSPIARCVVWRRGGDGGSTADRGGDGGVRGAGAALRGERGGGDAHPLSDGAAGGGRADGAGDRPAGAAQRGHGGAGAAALPAEGCAGVPHRARPGRPARLPASWEPALRRAAALDPHQLGVDRATWTTRTLADHLAAATGHRASIETVRVHLHRADYVCSAPPGRSSAGPRSSRSG